jgi:hypothetical protein
VEQSTLPPGAGQENTRKVRQSWYVLYSYIKPVSSFILSRQCNIPITVVKKVSSTFQEKEKMSKNPIEPETDSSQEEAYDSGFETDTTSLKSSVFG